MSISRAVDMKDIVMLREAIKKGGDINKQMPGPQKFTPLHVAVKDGNLEMVQEILKNEANPNIADGRGDTALHVAAKYSSPEINDELTKNGANANIKNKNGQIPLHVVGENTNKVDIAPIAAIHLNNGASMGALDKENKTPKDNKVLHDALDEINHIIDGEKTLELRAEIKLEGGDTNVIDRVLENLYGIDSTEADNKENQKDNSIFNNVDSKAFLQPLEPKKSSANSKNNLTHKNRILSDKKESTKNNQKGGLKR